MPFASVCTPFYPGFCHLPSRTMLQETRTYALVNFPRQTFRRAPLNAGTLFGKPKKFVYAKRANNNDSLNFVEMPKSSCLARLKGSGQRASSSLLTKSFCSPPPPKINFDILVLNMTCCKFSYSKSSATFFLSFLMTSFS